MKHAIAKKTIVFLVSLVVAIMHLVPTFAQSSICDKAEQQKRENFIQKDDNACLKSCEKSPDLVTCKKACNFMDNDAEKQLQKDFQQEDCLTKF